VWRELRVLVGKEMRGGDVQRRRPTVCEAAPLDPEEREEDRGTFGISIEIEQEEELLPWWEVERWDEILEERLLRDDLSHEGKRTLRKLLC
jgi:hypothetical protein